MHVGIIDSSKISTRAIEAWFPFSNLHFDLMGMKRDKNNEGVNLFTR